MNRSMINASNTMVQLQQQLNVISNNMSNVNTIGYKRQEVNFSEMLYQQFNNQSNEQLEVGRKTPMGIRQGVGAKLSHTSMRETQGVLQETDRMLDVALTKENQFFKVLTNENGQQAVRYTRDGGFRLLTGDNADTWQLVDSQGNAVLTQDDQPIRITGAVKEFKVAPDGIITVISEDDELPVQTFELGVVQVKRPQLLQGKGNSLYGLPNLNALNLTLRDVIDEVDGEERLQLNIRQGVLEESNVDVGSEMTELMVTQKSYQFNAKSISIADQMMGLVNGLRS